MGKRNKKTQSKRINPNIISKKIINKELRQKMYLYKKQLDFLIRVEKVITQRQGKDSEQRRKRKDK